MTAHWLAQALDDLEEHLDRLAYFAAELETARREASSDGPDSSWYRAVLAWEKAVAAQRSLILQKAEHIGEARP